MDEKSSAQRQNVEGLGLYLDPRAVPSCQRCAQEGWRLSSVEVAVDSATLGIEDGRYLALIAPSLDYLQWYA